MTRTLPAVFALAILVSPAVAVAQTSGTHLADVVATGMKVSVVDDDGRRMEGRVLDHSGESLRLSLDGSSQEIPIDRIVRIDKPDSLKNGALVGLGIGLAVGTFGVAVLSSSGNIEPEWMLAGIAYQTVAWTLLGTGHRRHVQQPSNALRARRTSPGPRLARRRARRPRRGGIGDLVATG